MTKLSEKKLEKKKSKPRPTAKVWIFILFALQILLRLVIAGVGISVIAGSLLYVWRSHTSPNIDMPPAQVVHQVSAPLPETPAIPSPELLAKLKELTPKPEVMQLQVLVLDVDTGTYANLNADQPFPAGGTIQLPILVAFFHLVDQGKLRLNAPFARPDGTKIPLLTAAVSMIRTGDNTAANILLSAMGGTDAVNQLWQNWQMKHTRLNSLLPDSAGSNTTSCADLVNLLSMVERGQILKLRSRDRLMDILARTEANELLPQGLGADARIYHKMGETVSSVGDAGIVDMPNGQRYLTAVLVKRLANDAPAHDLIRNISSTTYNFLSST
jgi:beta-lactamase class A